MEPRRVTIVTADTARTPNEGYTAGSNSMQDSGTALRNAAAQVREILLARAASRLDADVAALTVQDGTVATRDGRRVTYGELVEGQQLHVEAQPAARFKDPKAYTHRRRSRIAARGHSREDHGGYCLRARPAPAGHAARARRPTAELRRGLESVDTARRRRDRARRESGARRQLPRGRRRRASGPPSRPHARACAAPHAGTRTPGCRDIARLPAALLAMPAQDVVVEERRDRLPARRRWKRPTRAPTRCTRRSVPRAPSAQMQDGMLTVWSHTQGVYPDREAIAEMLAMPEARVRVVHMEGAGCYGHNGADDAAADAALIASRLQRRAGARAVDARGRASLGAVRLRDGGEGARRSRRERAHRELGLRRLELPALDASGRRRRVTRRAARIAAAFKPETPKARQLGRRDGRPQCGAALRVSELARGAPLSARHAAARFGAAVARRLPQRVRDRRASWTSSRRRRAPTPWSSASSISRIRAPERSFSSRLNGSAGRSPAHARARAAASVSRATRTCAAYCAVRCGSRRSIRHRPHSPRARRCWGGQRPDRQSRRLRNQIEGGILQSASWTLHERVAFDRMRIRSHDWSSYPILRFDGVPESLDVHIVDRPGDPFLGTGEAAQGPAAAAIGNAVANASGRRLRDLPLDFGSTAIPFDTPDAGR